MHLLKIWLIFFGLAMPLMAAALVMVPEWGGEHSAALVLATTSWLLPMIGHAIYENCSEATTREKALGGIPQAFFTKNGVRDENKVARIESAATAHAHIHKKRGTIIRVYKGLSGYEVKQPGQKTLENYAQAIAEGECFKADEAYDKLSSEVKKVVLRL